MTYDDSLAIDIADLANSLGISMDDAIFLTTMPDFPFSYFHEKLVVRLGDLNSWLKENKII